MRNTVPLLINSKAQSEKQNVTNCHWLLMYTQKIGAFITILCKVGYNN